MAMGEYKTIFLATFFINHIVGAIEIEDLVKGILFPRVPGTEGNFEAQTYIQNFFESEPLLKHWHLEKDVFDHDTVLGSKRFTNIIARFHPECPSFIVLGNSKVQCNELESNWYS